MGNYSTKAVFQMTQRDAYLDRLKLYDWAAEKSLPHMRLASKKVGQYISAAAIQAAITFPPLYLLSQFKKATTATIHFAEKIIGKRPALTAAGVIEGAFWWTPDPTSEIVALTLVGASATSFIFEKAVGKEKANKFYAPFYKIFNGATSYIPNSLKNKTSQKLSTIFKKAESFALKVKEIHAQTPAVTVYQPTFLK